MIYDEEDMKALVKEVLEECGIPRKKGIVGKIILRQRRYFALDFDDLLYYTLYILKNFPEVRAPAPWHGLTSLPYPF